MKAEALDQPMLIIESAKVLKSSNQFRNRAKVTHPEQLLFHLGGHPKAANEGHLKTGQRN